MTAERGRAAAARAGRGAGPPSCSRKAARGGVATSGAELRASTEPPLSAVGAAKLS